MKLTRRQLNQLIAESLDLELNEKANLIQRAKNAFVLFGQAGRLLKKYHREKDPQKQEAMLDKLCKLLDKLKLAKDAGDFEKGDINQATVNAAERTIKELEGICQGPAPSKEKVRDIIDELPAIEPDPTPEPVPWNPDPDPKVEWEYQNRDCIWYTRKKGTTKEYKLGHASGKPAERGGKFLSSIVKLNKAFPGAVKGCDPIVVVPKPKPEPKPKNPDVDPPEPTPGEATEYVMSITSKLVGIVDGSKELRTNLKVFLGTLSSAVAANVKNSKKILDGTFVDEAEELLIIARKLKETDPATNYQTMVVKKQYDDFLDRCSALGRGLRASSKSMKAVGDQYSDGFGGDKAKRVSQVAQQVLGSANGLDRVVVKFRNDRPNLSKGSTVQVNESLSRGSLYRRRYYGRY